MSDAGRRSLRILRVADVPDNRTGGMSRTMYCTGDELARMGHHVDYLFHEAFTWNIPRQVWRYLRSWEAMWLIANRLRRGEHWDVIEIHEPLAMAYAIRRSFNHAFPPLVIFSYGLEQRSYDAMRRYRLEKGIRFSLKSRITSRALVAQANTALRYADHVICSNQADTDYLSAIKGIPLARLTRHHSGVEHPFLEAGNRPPDTSRQGLLFVGSWIERKGILDLVPAVERLLEATPSTILTVAGCGCSADIVISSFRQSVRSRVRVIPHIGVTNDLIQLYRSHSILVLPSYFEGQPLVMVEAAALGLAIVTTPICGMLDFVDHGMNGVFTPIGDPQCLFNALLQLVANPEKTALLGENAKKRAASHTWHAAAVKIEQAYFSALELNSQGSR